MSTELPPLWPAGTELRRLETTPSTMDAAAALAPVACPTWVVARRQERARGRGGKLWHMPEGNFAATWIGDPTVHVAQRPQASFVAAIALREALDLFVQADRLKLKWPNDVLLDGKKVAGILLENRGESLAIGFGVNLLAAPSAEALPEDAWPVTSIAEATGDREKPRDQNRFLGTLAVVLHRWMGTWRVHGFEPIRRVWLDHAAGLGGKITVRLPKASLTGVFETVDADGCVVLKTPEGLRTIAAGDVFFDGG